MKLMVNDKTERRQIVAALVESGCTVHLEIEGTGRKWCDPFDFWVVFEVNERKFHSNFYVKFRVDQAPEEGGK
jgi:hypothetical protein